jgi:hypothetical protein
MKTIFSARTRSSTWRQLWIWLAEGEKELGIDISDEAIQQMKEHVVMTDEDFKVAAEEERKRRHDVYVPLRKALCLMVILGILNMPQLLRLPSPAYLPLPFQSAITDLTKF